MSEDVGPEVQRVNTGQSITKVGEFGYPQGHLGHLTEEEKQALEQFRKLVTDEKLYTPAAGGKPASHDDVTLLRFLRARRFVPKDALGQFRDTEVWRKQNHITDLYDNIDVNDYEETRRLYPQWTGRRDKRGIPVYVFEVAPLNSKTMGDYYKSSETTKVLNVPLGDKKKKKEDTTNVPPRLLRLFALYENLITFTMPLCTKLTDRPHTETPISQSNNIVDISNVGLKQFWNLRSHMQDASQLATAHYPETLDRIFIVGAPSFFPTVWSWIKRWFDPITVSKIFILTQSSAYQTLSSFIEPENIPTKYGGKLDWTWGDTPILDPEEAEHLHFAPGYGSEKTAGQSWPQGPMRWEPQLGNADTWDLVAVGSVDGKERRDVIGSLDFASVAAKKAADRQPSPSPAPDAAAAAAAAPATEPAAEPATGPAAAPAAAPAAEAAAGTAAGTATGTAVGAAAATAGVASLALDDEKKATEAQDGDVVVEKAQLPPQPLITPEVPLNAIASNLPAQTPGEVQKELGDKAAA